jgi:hypothetical protein
MWWRRITRKPGVAALASNNLMLLRREAILSYRTITTAKRIATIVWHRASQSTNNSGWLPPKTESPSNSKSNFVSNVHNQITKGNLLSGLHTKCSYPHNHYKGHKYRTSSQWQIIRSMKTCRGDSKYMNKLEHVHKTFRGILRRSAFELKWRIMNWLICNPSSPLCFQ